MKPFQPTKLGVTMRISDQEMLSASFFPMKGHTEDVPLTDEDRALHARAVAAYEEVMSNPWIELSGYEYEFEVRPLKPQQRFVAEETGDEHMARWVAAGRPVRNPVGDWLEASMRALGDRLEA